MSTTARRPAASDASKRIGLHAEEFDVATNRHLGNFPQAFSHLALIEAPSRIILAERLALEGLGPPSSGALASSIPPAQ